MNGEAGKGSVYRKVDQKKYELNWLRAFGVKCNMCRGHGEIRSPILYDDWEVHQCPKCNGSGYVKRKPNATR